MGQIRWDEETMGTSVISLDEQHRDLIVMLNHLMDAILQGKGKTELGGMLQLIGNDATKHFADEEGVMAEHRCPMAAANKAAHAKFLRDFKLLAEKFERGGATPSFVMELQQKVLNWLCSHMQKCDTSLRQCSTGRAA